MQLIWNPHDAAPWQDLHARQLGSLQQAWAYGQALQSLGVEIHRAEIRQGQRLLGLAQFQCRRLAFYIGLASCSRGPVWAQDTAPDEQRQALALLKKSIPTRPWRATVFSPELAAGDALPQGLRGLHRVMTGYSTVMLDLRRSQADLRAALDGKWRNRLVRAEGQQSLQVHVRASGKEVQWLLERENLQRESRGFHALPTAFVQAYIDSHAQRSEAFVVASATRGRQTLGAMLFLRHGRCASYHIGWADEEGRRLNIHNLLLWQAMLSLQGQGIERLDLGGVNTRALPGISRFKLGTGGQVLTLAGTYF
jgi:Acetyltransferase (GNAT) domain